MGVFTAAAAIGTKVLTTIGATTLAGSFVVSAAVGFLTQAAVGLALNALAPKPKSQSSQGVGGYRINGKQANLDHQIIYGETRVGGAIVFEANSNDIVNAILYRVYAHTGHPIEGYKTVYIADKEVTQWGLTDGTPVSSPAAVPNGTPLIPLVAGGSTVYDPRSTFGFDGGVTFRFYDGTQTTADPHLISRNVGWTSDHILQGTSYMITEMFHGLGTAWPNGVPQFTCLIQGKKVYDPRTDTTAWSDNSALCLRDYLTSEYGLNESSSNIDDDLVSTAADVCDQTAINGEKRYTCNGAFTTGVTPIDLISEMLTSMGGLLWYAQGKWRMKPAYYTAPTIEFTEDDLRSSIALKTRHSRRDNFNVVKGTFKGPQTLWELTDYPEVRNQFFIDADNGQESVVDLNLPFTDNVDEARRIARIFLERNRQQLTVSASFGMRAFQVQVGDIVQLTVDRFGWSQKEFEVSQWTFGLTDAQDLQVQMTLREISESVFDEVDDGVVYERDNTTLLSPFDVPSPGLTVTDAARISNQKVTNVANLEITSGQADRITSVEVQYKKSSETDWTDAGRSPIGTFTIVDLETDRYDFRVRAINTFGVRGDYTFVLNKEINPFVGPPSDVTNFQFELSGGTIFFEWNAISDPDLSHYRIKLNTSTSGATWGNSSTVIDKISRPGTSASLPARSGTFLIKAYDKEGNESVNATSVVVLPGQLPPLGTEQTATEDPTFAGTKTNVVLVSSAIEIDDTTASNPSGEYLFDVGGTGYIDTGSSRTCRVTGFVTFTRAFDGAGSLLWDNIPDNWDTWPENWDDWTTETTNFGDVSAIVYVSATDDDPSGTPTWGAYQPANGSEVVGRAFRFKAILSSENTDYTPNVTELSATVEY